MARASPVDLEVIFVFKSNKAMMMTKPFNKNTCEEYNAIAIDSNGDVLDEAWGSNTEESLGYLLFAGSQITSTITPNGLRTSTGKSVVKIMKKIKHITTGDIISQSILFAGRTQMTILIAGYDITFKTCWKEIESKEEQEHYFDQFQEQATNAQKNIGIFEKSLVLRDNFAESRLIPQRRRSKSIKLGLLEIKKENPIAQTRTSCWWLKICMKYNQILPMIRAVF